MNAQTFVLVLTIIFALTLLFSILSLPFVAIWMANNQKGLFEKWVDKHVVITGVGEAASNYFGEGFNRDTGLKDGDAKKSNWEKWLGIFYMGLFAKKWQTVSLQTTIPIVLVEAELCDGTLVTINGNAVLILEDIPATLREPDWKNLATDLCRQAMLAEVTKFKSFEELRTDSGNGGKLISCIIGNGDLQDHLKKNCGHSLDALPLSTIQVVNPKNEIQKSQQEIIVSSNRLKAARKDAEAIYVKGVAPHRADAEGERLRYKAQATGLKDLKDTIGDKTLEFVDIQSRSLEHLDRLPKGLTTLAVGGNAGLLINPGNNTAASQDGAPEALEKRAETQQTVPASSQQPKTKGKKGGNK